MDFYRRWLELDTFRAGKSAQKIQQRRFALQIAFALTMSRDIEVVNAGGQRLLKT